MIISIKKNEQVTSHSENERDVSEHEKFVLENSILGLEEKDENNTLHSENSVPGNSTDVNVAPEHEKLEHENSILGLEEKNEQITSDVSEHEEFKVENSILGLEEKDEQITSHLENSIPANVNVSPEQEKFELRNSILGLEEKNEQITLHLENERDVSEHDKFKLENSNLGPGEKDEQITSHSENSIPEHEKLPADVNVAPEHEKFVLENTILGLEGEIEDLRLKQRSLDDKRKEALNKILDTKGCIRVLCRIRPLLSSRKKSYQAIVADSEKIAVGSGGNKKEFGFDKVFTQETTQDDVFLEVKPILRSALDGHNACVIAYGQTGTGKTYTMDGTNDSPGIVLRALKELFGQSLPDNSSLYTFSISMLEVYLGNIKDLLAPKASCKPTRPILKCNLNIQTDPKGYIEIEGLTEVEISNFTKASWWYTKGRRARSTSWTNVNEASSRSHCLTRINIFRRGGALGEKSEVSKLWMVDLGGSERLLKTGATGQRLDEGRAINLSLSGLGDVIAALKKKRGHVPYRNCKLTQILKDSLGYGSKVVMLVHISQYEDDVAETTCSLAFAQRARGLESTRELPEELKRQKEKKIAELEEEMREAEVEHQNITKQIQKTESMLSENRKLFWTKYKLVEDEDQAPSRENEELRDNPKTPKKCEKDVKQKAGSSLPRFMNATMASRQRQSAAEREIETKAKMLRSWARSSLQISGSQSHSFVDSHLKAHLKNSKPKTATGEKTTPLIETTRFNVSDTRAKVVASSDPNVKVTIGRHRRRMSNMI